MYRILDRLPSKYRDVIILFELEGASGEEIAELTGRKLATVWVHLHRAGRFLEALRTKRGRSMKQLHFADRWVARGDDGGPEARAGALLRQAFQREPLEARRLDAIRARLRRARRRPQRRHWMLRLAISLALVASGGALTAAAQRYLRWTAPAQPAPPPRAAPAAPQRPARTRTSVPPAPPADPAPAPLDEPMPLDEVALPSYATAASPSVARRPAAFERAPVTPPPLAPAPQAPSSLAEESALIAEALRKLRQGDDAPARSRSSAHTSSGFRAARSPPRRR